MVIATLRFGVGKMWCCLGLWWGSVVCGFIGTCFKLYVMLDRFVGFCCAWGSELLGFCGIYSFWGFGLGFVAVGF